MNCCCDPLALTTAVNTLAVAMAQQMTANELSLVSALLTQLGDTLGTIAVQREICEDEQQLPANIAGLL